MDNHLPLRAFGGEILVVNLKHVVPVPPVTEKKLLSSYFTALFGFVEGLVSVISWNAEVTTLNLEMSVATDGGDGESRYFNIFVLKR
jgi:hypothetical protein